jgi:hypothetical protein
MDSTAISVREGGAIMAGHRRCCAVVAELCGIGLIRVPLEALDGDTSFPPLAWLQISRGMDGKSNVLDSSNI